MALNPINLINTEKMILWKFHTKTLLNIFYIYFGNRGKPVYKHIEVYSNLMFMKREKMKGMKSNFADK